jgi:hypothetical protein
VAPEILEIITLHKNQEIAETDQTEILALTRYFYLIGAIDINNIDYESLWFEQFDWQAYISTMS